MYCFIRQVENTVRPTVCDGSKDVRGSNVLAKNQLSVPIVSLTACKITNLCMPEHKFEISILIASIIKISQ